MTKLYGFSSASSLAILILAVCIPTDDGLNVTSKVVVPFVADIGEEGTAVTVKSEEP